MRQARLCRAVAKLILQLTPKFLQSRDTQNRNLERLSIGIELHGFIHHRLGVRAVQVVNEGRRVRVGWTAHGHGFGLP